ncbi:putative muramidase [Pseudomonas phage phiZ98]|nr:putative muramidase [Pseudomonas phage phiZ98]
MLCRSGCALRATTSPLMASLARKHELLQPRMAVTSLTCYSLKWRNSNRS